MKWLIRAVAPLLAEALVVAIRAAAERAARPSAVQLDLGLSDGEPRREKSGS